jgi:glucose/arabinose dehydrogenase
MVIAALAAALSLAACNDDGGDDVTPSVAATAAEETTPEATAQQAAPLELDYVLAPEFAGLALPDMLGLEMYPGEENEAIVLQQTGQMWRIALDNPSLTEPFGDISDRLISPPGREEGLLGLAFSPDFESDGRVFLYYSAGPPRQNTLSSFPVVDGVIDTAQEQFILQVDDPFDNHNAGQIEFGPDGYLYVGLGDGGFAGDPQGNGQDLSTLLGSLLRIDVSGDSGYAVPPDNPFVDTPDAAPEIYAYGLRNPWRFSFDSESGDLWLGDVGQDAWEEVDRIEAGGNYGWNVMEGMECFGAPGCDQSGLTLPRVAYGREGGNCSITGGYVYRGEAMPELEGWYVYGDFCTGNIWAVNSADETSPAVLLSETGMQITSFAELPDGELAVVTFSNAIFVLERTQIAGP